MNLSSFRYRSLACGLSITTLTAIATAVQTADSLPTAPFPSPEKSGAEAP